MTAERQEVGSPLGGSVSRTSRLRELLGAATPHLSILNNPRLARAALDALSALLDALDAYAAFDDVIAALSDARRVQYRTLVDALAALDNRKDKP